MRTKVNAKSKDEAEKYVKKSIVVVAIKEDGVGEPPIFDKTMESFDKIMMNLVK